MTRILSGFPNRVLSLGVASLMLATPPMVAGATWQARPLVAAKSSRPIRILFIGNSFTYVNNLPELVRGMAAALPSPIEIETKQVTVGGATLMQLWNGGPALAAIRGSRWD